MSDDPADVDLDRPGDGDPVDYEAPRKLPLVPLVLLGVAAVLALAAVGAYRYLYLPSRQLAPAATAPADRSPNNRTAEQGEPIILPPLDETDAIVRELIGQLSKHPTIAAWLTNDGLIVNFAVVAQRIANGESPAKEVGTVVPIPGYKPRMVRDRLFVDPESYHRYDRYAEAVSALDARGTARLYATLKPRIGEAYKRMSPASDGRGTPVENFDPVLERAIGEMLRVPVIQGEIELVPRGLGFGYADPKLEELSAAQKHLLRMGPQNVQTIQAKLREIADYLAIPASRLARPSAP